jgi:hypothetical protein
MIAAGWVLSVGLVGMMAHLTTVSSWVLLASAAVVPPLVMLKLWRPPAQSISESIRKELQ